MSAKIDLTGRRFGKLVVIKSVPKPENKKTKGSYWLCKCDCGGSNIYIIDVLRAGETNSCGCLKLESSLKKLEKLNGTIINPYEPKILTQEQKDIINGHMLGDGSLKRCGLGSMLTIRRSVKDRKYLEYTENKLKNLYDPDKSSIYDLKINDPRKEFNKYGEDKYYVGYHSSSKEILNNFHKKWYPNDNKIIPRDLELTTRMVAVWFNDDGCSSVSKKKISISFSTHGFLEEDVDFLVKLLENKYKIKVHKNRGGKAKDGHIKCCIRIYCSNVIPIIKEVEPFLAEMGMLRKKTWDDELFKKYEKIYENNLKKVKQLI